MPAHGAVFQRHDPIRQTGIDQRLRADDRARAPGAVHHDQRIRVCCECGYPVDQLGSRTIECTGNVHHRVFAHRPGIDHQDVLTGIQLCLQIGRGDARRGITVLDILAERLAGHEHAGIQLVACRAPGTEPASQHMDVAIPETTQYTRRTLCERLVIIGQDDPRPGTWHQATDQPLEMRKRAGRGKEQVVLAVHTLFARIQDRKLAVVGDHRLELTGGDSRRKYLRPGHESLAGSAGAPSEEHPIGQVFQRLAVQMQVQ